MAPSRPRSHRLESESRLAFATAATSHHVFRELDPDYGLDGELEEFDTDGRATGLKFNVQLKATDRAQTNDGIVVTLPTKQLDYYRSLTTPTLMVLYSANDKSLFARWTHQFDPYYEGGGPKSVRFRWSPSDRWTDHTLEHLWADTRAFRRLRSAFNPLPATLWIEPFGDGVLGLTTSRLLHALRAATSSRPDLVDNVARGPAPPGFARLFVAEHALTVDLARVAGATLHLDQSYDAGPAASNISNDAVILLALSLERLGQDVAAARLASAFFAASSLAGMAEVAGTLAAVFRRSGLVRESIELAQTLDSQVIGMGAAFTLPAIATARVLGQSDALFVIAASKDRSNRQMEAGQAREAAAEVFTLACFYRSRTDFESANTAFEEVLRIDPTYADFPHFWYYCAGSRFMIGNYEGAATAYRQALDGGYTHTRLKALLADSLIWSGDYRSALQLLKEFNIAHPEPRNAEYRLKERFLSQLVAGPLADAGRNPEDASNRMVACQADSSGPPSREATEEILRLDPLCGYAWFSLGVHFLASDGASARECFIASACVDPTNGRAWAGLAMFAHDTGDDDLLADCAIAGNRLAGAGLVDVLVEGNAPDRLLEHIEQIVGSLPHEDIPLEIRDVSEPGATLELANSRVSVLTGSRT